MSPQMQRQRRILWTAVVLGLIAVGFYVGFFFVMSKG
jgi:hypothetical protein